MSLQLGLKVWSSNRAYIPDAGRLLRDGVCQYVELYVDPAATDEDLKAWKPLAGKVCLHAPHSYAGFNPSLAALEKSNRQAIERVERYREAFEPAAIVFHPGIEGSLDESARQFLAFKKDFPELFQVALIENKPAMGLKRERCLGARPEEIKALIERVGFGFCLDFGHAVCTAASLKRSWKDLAGEFMAFGPSMCHLSDGDVDSVRDQHLHYGEGNFDLRAMLKMIPSGTRLTIETKHDHPDRLDDFPTDVKYLQRLLA